MGVHFGFRDSPCCKPGTLILGFIAPPLLPWDFACLRFADTRTGAFMGLGHPIEPSTVAAPHDKARHPLMGLRLLDLERFTTLQRRDSFVSPALQRVGQLTPCSSTA